MMSGMFNLAKPLAVCCIALGIHAAERPHCVPIPGAEQLWKRPGLRFVIVGEMHGTTEAPAIFGDLVCSARETKRHIIVGIELRDQHALDMFMVQPNHAAEVKRLLSSEEWSGDDGRTSTAMLSLLERLRALKMDGVVSDIVAFSLTRGGESASKGEERMASALLEAGERHPNALVIALTGNVHACKKILAEVGSYGLMASFLPAAQTMSLAITDRGGQAWNCQNGACGPHPLDPSAGERRAVRSASPHPCFDGVLSTGVGATASRPASH